MSEPELQNKDIFLWKSKSRKFRKRERSEDLKSDFTNFYRDRISPKKI